MNESGFRYDAIVVSSYLITIFYGRRSVEAVRKSRGNGVAQSQDMRLA